MKHLFKTFAFVFLLSTTSCIAQKMVQRIDDAKELQINEKQFIGKPLKALLAQIGPQIKSSIGNPDSKSKETSPMITFYFVDKNEFRYRNSRGEKPTHISVLLQPAINKSYPQLSGANPWTKEQVKAYGDMIITKLWVSGEN